MKMPSDRNKTTPPLDPSDETWDRLQSALRARRVAINHLADLTDEVRSLERLRYGHPITEKSAHWSEWHVR